MKEQIETLVNEYFLKANTPEVRNELKEELELLTGYNFKDETTPEEVDKNSVIYDGVDPISNKLMKITIRPKGVIIE